MVLFWGDILLTWNGLFTQPLDPEGIEKHTKILHRDYLDSECQQMRSFIKEDDGKPILMVDGIKTNDVPKTINGQTYSSLEEAFADHQRFLGPYSMEHNSWMFLRYGEFKT